MFLTFHFVPDVDRSLTNENVSVKNSVPSSGSHTERIKKMNVQSPPVLKPELLHSITGSSSISSTPGIVDSGGMTDSSPTPGTVESGVPSSVSLADSVKETNDQSPAFVQKFRFAHNKTDGTSTSNRVESGVPASGSRKGNSSTFESQQYTLSVSRADTDNSTDDENTVCANSATRKKESE